MKSPAARPLANNEPWHTKFGGYPDDVWERRRVAMREMANGCAALNGDGVVAVRVTIEPFEADERVTRFQVFGTAVRAIGRVRPPQPFLSCLSGQGFAKLIQSGWVPVDIALGASAAVLHDERSTRSPTRRFGPIQEVDTWTKLVSGARKHARKMLRKT